VKANREKNRREMGKRPRKLSVTRSETMPKKRRRVTLKKSDSPSKRYLRLRPWLDLANLVLPISLEREPGPSGEMIERVLRYLADARDSADFPASSLRNSFIPSDKTMATAHLFSLAIAAARALAFCDFERGSTPARTLIGRQRIYQLAPQTMVWLDRSDGRVRVEVFDPYRDYFLPAFKDIEAERVRRCPICMKLFFARRSIGRRRGKDTSSKACSKQCNSTRRTREYRQEQQRKVAEARQLYNTQPRRDIIEIAKRLDTSPEKVRRYLGL
jgi:hypothetical protein